MKRVENEEQEMEEMNFYPACHQQPSAQAGRIMPQERAYWKVAWLPGMALAPG